MKTKVVFITSEKFPVPPVRGGAVETWIDEAAKNLKNHEIHSLCMDDPLVKKDQLNSDIHYSFYAYDWLAKVLLCTYKLPFKQERSTLYYSPYSRWCAQYARKIQADIIHLHSRPQFIPILRKLNPQAKIILHVHNVSVFDLDGWLWPKEVMQKVDSVATCSDYLRREFIERYPYMKDKTKVLYNALDSKRFDPQNISPQTIRELSQKYNIHSNDKVILFTGRLIEYKGVHLLIDAFKSLLKSDQNLKLFIVGGLTYSNNEETPYIRQLKESIKGYEEKIIFTGFVDAKFIPAFLELADVYVVPSLWKEPFGVAVIEGMAMEKAVVAFKTGGIPEIIEHRINGLLVEDKTAQALKNAIQILLDEPQLRLEIGQQARQSVLGRFAWPIVIKDIERCYNELKSEAIHA